MTHKARCWAERRRKERNVREIPTIDFMITAGLHKNDVKMSIAEECSATSREQEPLNKNKVSWADIVKRQK